MEASSGVTRNFLRGRGGGKSSTNSVEAREYGDLGAVAPYSGVPLNLQMSETLILIRLLRIYFPLNREFGSALSKLRNFGVGVEPPPPTPLCTPLEFSGQFHAPAIVFPGTEPQYPLNIRLGGPQSRSGRCLENKKSLAPTGIRKPDRPPGSVVTILPTLYHIHTKHYWLCY
jgi:hypothetical protein